MYVGCPGNQLNVTIQPPKTRPKLLCQNKNYIGHKLEAYISLLARMQRQKKTVAQTFLHMISSAQSLKHKIHYLNILVQRQIIQTVSVDFDILGDFSSILFSEV